jgi:hypothetical protein
MSTRSKGREPVKRGVLLVAVIPIAASLLVACGGAVSDEYVIEEQPYRLEQIEGEEVARVILTASAAQHIGIQTAPVEELGSLLVVPLDAVYIDAHGGFWVYTNPEPLVFVRAPIDIARETSAQAFLDEGPPAGTRVVTVGAPELYGSETEFGT